MSASKINEDLDNVKANESEVKETSTSKGIVASITGGGVAVAVATYFIIASLGTGTVDKDIQPCISVNGGGQTTELVAQGKGHLVGTVFFEYSEADELMVTITDNAGKKLNNAGVAFDKSLDNLLDKYANGNNIVDGKVKDANKEYITKSRAGEVVFTFKNHVFESGEKYYFIVYCSQGWGAGQAFGPSGLNGSNGYVIPVEFYDCAGKNCEEIITIASIAEIEKVVPVKCRETVKTLIITGTNVSDFSGIKNIGGEGKILPNLANVILENFAGKIPNRLFPDNNFTGFDEEILTNSGYDPKTTTKYGNAWLETFSAPNATAIEGNAAFYGCVNLKSISLPSATTIGTQTFYLCYNLKTVYLPQAITIGGSAFQSCVALEEISLPNAITIEGTVFNGCHNLATITCENVTDIGVCAFATCRTLTDVFFPNAVNVESQAFTNCRNLTTISMPNATNFGNGIFLNCVNLTTATLGSKTSDAISWDNISLSAFSGIPTKQVTLHLGAKTFERDFPKEKSPLLNKSYQGYTFKAIHKNGDTVMPILFPIIDLEIPETKPGDEIVRHTAYSLVYNEDHEQADWVAYMLCKERTKKEVARKDHFREDPKIKTGSATLADYSKSGYDRGHLVPCNDMVWSFVPMDESFFMSNMSPHHQNFHQAGGIWYKLEDLVQKWAGEYDTLYIVVGPALQQGISGSIGANKVSIPEYYYKVILNYTINRIEGIGFIMPHEHVKSGKPIRDFAVSIDSVQKFTGINFYHNIPDKKLEDSIEKRLCINCWTW